MNRRQNENASRCVLYLHTCSSNFFFTISSLNSVFLLVKDHCWKLVVNNVFFTITCLSTTCLISRENAHQIVAVAVIQNNNAIRILFDTSSMSSLQFQNGVSRWRSCYRVSSCWGVRMAAAAALAMSAAVTTWPSPVYTLRPTAPIWTPPGGCGLRGPGAVCCPHSSPPTPPLPLVPCYCCCY